MSLNKLVLRISSWYQITAFITKSFWRKQQHCRHSTSSQ